MKKVIALLLTAVLLVGCLAGCGGKSGSDKTVVTFWTQDTVSWQAYFEPAIARFEEANPDIDIQVEYFSDFAEKINQSFSAGTEANVIFTYSSVGEFADAGKIQAVPENVYTTEEMESLFYSGATANKIVNDKYYAVPNEINVESPNLFVNMTKLKELGVSLPDGWVENNGPASWAELLEFAKSVTVKDSNGNITQAGLAYCYAQWEAMFESLIWQFGGEFRDEENLTVHFETEEARQALEFMLKHLGTGEDAVCAGNNSRYTEFVEGTAVMCVGAPWYAGSFDVDIPDTEYQVFNMPAYVEGADPVSLATGGWAYIVSSQCDDATSEAAWKFVKYMTSADEVGEWAVTAGALPSRVDALTDMEYDPNVGSVEKAIAISTEILGYAQEDGAYMLTSSTLTYTIIREALYQLLEDGDVDACLSTIQSQAETMLDENFNR